MCKKFGVENGNIISGEVLKNYEHTKPRPERLFLYKPSRRKYDFVDYTGELHDERVNLSDCTAMLEFYGFIKFIGSKDDRRNDKIF